MSWERREYVASQPLQALIYSPGSRRRIIDAVFVRASGENDARAGVHLQRVHVELHVEFVCSGWVENLSLL